MKDQPSKDNAEARARDDRAAEVVIDDNTHDSTAGLCRLILRNKTLGVSIPLVELLFVCGPDGVHGYWSFHKILSRPLELWLDMLRTVSPRQYWRIMEAQPKLDELVQWVQDQVNLIQDCEQFMMLCTMKA